MKRNYTTTDLIVLRRLSKPGWVHEYDLLRACQNDQLFITRMTIHNSLTRLVTDDLVEIEYVNDNVLDAIHARRLCLTATLSRILAA